MTVARGRLSRQYVHGLQPPRQWIERNLWIAPEEGGIIPFRYSPIQLELDRTVDRLRAANRLVRILLLKSRQVWGSTWTEARIFEKCRRNAGQRATIISHDKDSAGHLYGMFQLFHQRDPSPLPTDYSNRKELVYSDPHGSRVLVETAQNAHAGSSFTNQALHISELAKWPPGTSRKTMLSLLGTLHEHQDSFGVIESTAFGATGYFYELWQDAVKGLNAWEPVFFGWWQKPGNRMPVGRYPLDGIGENERYNAWPGEETALVERFSVTPEQLTWRRWAVDNKCGGSLDDLHQDQPATAEEAFVSSGRPRFDMRVLSRWEAQAKPPIWRGDVVMDGGQPRMVEGPPYHVQIWEMPVTGEDYAAGADVAQGLANGDWNSAVFLAKGRRRMVAKIRAKFGGLESDAYADRLNAVGRLYNAALLVPERNTGVAVIEELLKSKYPTNRLYHDMTRGEEVRELTQRIGWYTTRTAGGGGTKPILLDGIATAIRDEVYRIEDGELIAALKSCITHKDGTVGDAQGHTPDDVMALGMAIQGVGYSGEGFLKHWGPANLREVET